ncbi:hypothetical protein K505DRAFT_385638 [Melanomma pulvis-pyrius CBS 109.77]|uniref:Zn(2)-C6 fungal-type domain-containing protein n=1 Tax=Melanomma pulvis-pyrius CBS 109.77 TaxID=1314802 RepID=A0A6A6XCK6_9PLEO|nr:hypothetical protein K505DRAFT_385638 [Melanomma pulvis-pyrius CBS 109.77]
MNETGEVRCTKRARSHRSSDYTKRRAPYAMRACDACRRRKGKCDGRLPCKHCVARKLYCSFTGPTPADDLGDRPVLDSHQAPSSLVGEDDLESLSMSQHDGHASSRTFPPSESIGSPPANASTFHQCKGDAALMDLVSNLQRQLDSLTSRVRLSNSGRDDASPMQTTVFRERSEPIGIASRTSTKRFHGPTSPDYSLNVVQIRLRHTSSSTMYQHPLIANIDNEASSIESGDGMTAKLATKLVTGHPYLPDPGIRTGEPRSRDFDICAQS